MGLDLIAVQPYMTLADYVDEDAFSSHLRRLFLHAEALRREDEAVVVLPEDLATFLALAAAPEGVRDAPTLDAAFSLIARRRLLPLARAMIRWRSTKLPVAFFHLVADHVYGAWFRTMSALARAFRVTVVAGSALLPANRYGYGTDRFDARDGRVYNLALTFAPDGRVVIVTRKRNLVPTQEDVLFLSRGPDTPPDPIPLGSHRLGVAICYDAFTVAHTDHEPGFDPLVPKLARLGADIIAQPSANPWPWEEPWRFRHAEDHRPRKEQWRAEGLREALVRVPSVRAGIVSQLLATLFDMHFDGQSAIYVREGDAVLTVVEAARGDAQPDAETVIGWSLPF